MFNLKLFIKSAIHLGHQTQKWNPRTSFFLLGNHDNVLVVDLHQTFFMFRRAFSFIQKICKNRGMILYISSSPIDKFPVYKNAKQCTSPAAIKLGFGNGNLREENRETQQLAQGVLPYFAKNSAAIEKNGTWKSSSKTLRELILSLRKKRLERFFIPEALFVLDPGQNKTLIREALKLQIPIMAVIDTNTNPFGIQYPIPGNNVSQESLSLYTKFLMHSIAFAKKQEIKQICQ